MKDNPILRSWDTNSSEWIKLLKADGIESRRFTNKAIIEKIAEYEPEHILDLGCGEGWLTRALSQLQYSVKGIDATRALIEEAKSKSDQEFFQLSYEEIESGTEIPGVPYDAVVFNFSLYNDELSGLFRNLKKALKPDGKFFIQTIHPYFLIQNVSEYKSQWIENSWKGLKGEFKDPHPWYARTLSDWLNEFKHAGLELAEISEPLNDLELPISIIFTCGIK